ncbi:Putative membrane protein [Vibrio coralliirubri]|uniref:sulfite exporter TauE/SafE family protein n=1 Tax=Vibrio coralliirubri TaxID=1516159 RepID=UPI00062EB1AE|nr:sulfite exporter TauE/SafE family protein [Vibrio coralliirubri]CDT85594.1 Putative membrane protein [Vibrio coralliirubri]
MDWLILFLSGVIGGVLNSIAGGGSFITFPALLFAGVPPIAANATNTFASCAGYISGAYALRHEIQSGTKQLKLTIALCVIGGGIGAFLLLHTPEALFTQSVPWLLLFAALLFTFGGTLNKWLKQATAKHKHATSAGAFFSALLLLIVCIYGGYFNAGLGIVTLSYLALAGYTNINVMNGIKLLVSACASLAAIVFFIVNGSIDWPFGMAVLLGTLVGGYYSAKISRRIPQQYVRTTVIIASFLITAYFFYTN